MPRSAGEKISNNLNYKFWHQDNHPIELDSNDLMDQKLIYIHHNPVGEDTVDEPEHYLNSSARNYSGMKGLIGVNLIE